MSTSGYEIRHALLMEAKGILFERWHMQMEIERLTADHEKRAPVMLECPSVVDIKNTADELYQFVQKR